MKISLLRKENIYLTLVYFVGFSLFFLTGTVTFGSISDWILGYALIGATLILNHYKIQLPPEGNSLSMDSAVYLACLFIFDLEITLGVLFFTSVIFFFYHRATPWWTHLFNFSSYTIMLVGAYYTYTLLGGTTGSVESANFFTYLVTLALYFFINVMLISIFFYVAGRASLFESLKGLVRGTIESYLSTLLLAIILSFLLQAEPFFGLFLFISVSVLLSFAFRQHFKLYLEVANKANLDHLTGLYNHGYFKELLDSVLKDTRASGEMVSLAILDIDDFKKYNDTYGHMKGDNLLKFFSQILKKEIGSRNFTVARYGGEEFVILMPSINQLEASRLVDQLRKKVNDTYFEGVELLPYGCLSFSAGITEYHKEIMNSSEFLSNADQAMYYAKAQGKNNTHIFGHELEAVSIDKQMEEMEQQLKLLLSKDIYTYRHSKRVFKYAVEFAKQLPLKDYEKKNLMLGALIHDIGKIEVPREIINKKGKLELREWETIKMHVTWGRDIVSTNKEFADLLPLVELHHERFDGKGYPYGLKGEEIPKLARILCIIDSFDAMTTERPYQRTKTIKEGLEELTACSGTQFDPEYVNLFVNYIENEILLEQHFHHEKSRLI